MHHDRDHAALPTVSRITGVLNPIPPEGIGSGPVINVKETGDVKIRTTWVEMCFFPMQHQVFFLENVLYLPVLQLEQVHVTGVFEILLCHRYITVTILSDLASRFKENVWR